LPAIIPPESGSANLSRNSAIFVAIGDWSLLLRWRRASGCGRKRSL